MASDSETGATGSKNNHSTCHDRSCSPVDARGDGNQLCINEHLYLKLQRKGAWKYALLVCNKGN